MCHKRDICIETSSTSGNGDNLLCDHGQCVCLCASVWVYEGLSVGQHYRVNHECTLSYVGTRSVDVCVPACVCLCVFICVFVNLWLCLSVYLSVCM